MAQQLRIMVSAGFGEGHAYPALALARALKSRGHEVLVELSARWRTQVESMEMGFTEAVDYVAFPGVAPPDPRWPTVLETVNDLAPVLERFGPDIVVSDLVAPAPALAAEVAGVPAATLIPIVYPIQAPSAPPFQLGMRAPRTAVGRGTWRLLQPLAAATRDYSRWLRRVPDLLAETRTALGLVPARVEASRITTYGALSETLCLVATLPQLEYPRPWPAHVRVTGPMRFELPHPDIDLPPGDEPLILVAASTVHSGTELARAALVGLAAEPVRVLVTLNRPGTSWDGPAPANAKVVDWLSYAQAMPRASAVISTGGHGTVARTLSEGRPALICPEGAETAENGARVSWSGAGAMLPRRLLSPASLRLAVRRLLADGAYGARAAEIAAWASRNDGAERGAQLIEAAAQARR